MKSWWKAVKFLAYKDRLLGDFWVVDFFVRKAVFFTCVICQDASNATIWSAVRKDRTKNWAQKIKAKNNTRSQRCHAILVFFAQSVKDLIAEFHWASLHSVPAFDLLAETKDAERSCHAFTLVSNQWASWTRWTDKTLRHLWHLTVLTLTFKIFWNLHFRKAILPTIIWCPCHDRLSLDLQAPRRMSTFHVSTSLEAHWRSLDSNCSNSKCTRLVQNLWSDDVW